MTVVADQLTKPRVKRWTKREYNALVDRGFFQGQRVYLYRGELIEVPPMGSLHARGIANITSWLIRTFDPGYVVRIQSPFDTPGESMPEPDGAVVTHAQMARKPHPNEAALLIEVSDSSVEIDQEKALDYAAAQVPEYWIINVRDRLVEVFRKPVADPNAVLGFKYLFHQVAGESDVLSPLVKPEISVRVADLISTT